MGREIRKVPPNWKHPEDGQAMCDQNFGAVFTEWLNEFDRIRDRAGDSTTATHLLSVWLQDEGRPPDPKFYRPWRDEDATWFQVWETVSEGSPVTPPFATKTELIEYLVFHGDFWDQKGGKGGWSRESAMRFVNEDGFRPSMIVTRSPEGTKILMARDQ